MNEIICAYCDKPIEDEKKSIYKYFPAEGIHKKVHFHHLQVKKESDEAQTKITRRNRN